MKSKNRLADRGGERKGAGAGAGAVDAVPKALTSSKSFLSRPNHIAEEKHPLVEIDCVSVDFPVL